MLHKKKLLLLTAGLAVSLATLPVLAQDAPPQDPPAAEASPAQATVFDGLETQLALTDAQKPKVHPIFVSTQAQLQAVQDDKDSTPEIKQQKTLELIKGLPVKLNPLLDDTQKATLASFIAQITTPQE